MKIEKEENNFIDSIDSKLQRKEFNIVFYDGTTEIGRFDFEEFSGHHLTPQDVMVVLKGLVRDINRIKKEFGLTLE